ncbi:polysaccharide deacetylase family protein [Bacillus marinisedimentorum]|uniref:polysaccharide deacetylase family protein n=1 Tax=Bacillus marinisedimentorum TaxID=1821260 RepID=UPI0007DE5973|nr:polysaccharide deacetylase family protein [Bacillus marinisedimentorum]
MAVLIGVAVVGLLLVAGIFGKVNGKKWSALAFSLAAVGTVIAITLAGISYFGDSAQEPEPVSGDANNGGEIKASAIEEVTSVITAGMPLTEYETAITGFNLELAREFMLENGSEGIIYEAADGFIVITMDNEKVTDIKSFATLHDAAAYEEELKAAAIEEEQKNDDESVEPPAEDDSDEPEPPSKDDDTGEPEPPAGGDDSDKPDPPAADDDINVPDDSYVLYKVVSGDTLWSIAQRADVTVDQLKTWNSLSTDTIYVGQALKIYGIDAVPPPAPPPAPPAASPSILIIHGSLQQKEIAFTFDAGSDAAGIRILDVLKKHNVKSTFFLTGKWAEKFPSYAKRIAADGHEIAAHSYSHPDFTAISYDAILQEMARAERAIVLATGKSPRPYFRFPYGAYNTTALKAVGQAGYPYSIQWSLDTLDWKQPSVDYLVSRITANASNGDIVLMHIGGINTPEAVDRVIPVLKAKGYKIVTVTEVRN